MPGRKPCEVGCRCAKHPEGKLPPDEQRQKARERDAVRYRRDDNRRDDNARRYYADVEGSRAYARERRAADPARAREIDRRSKDKNREQRRARDRAIGPEKRLRCNHDMTSEDFAGMWAAQDGRCYLCDEELPRDRKQVHIDHDHTCCPPNKSCEYCRRGLACQACNTGIGCFRDDPDRMERIAAKLRVAKTATRQQVSTKPVQAELFDINEAASRQKKESALWLLAKALGVYSMSSRRSASTHLPWMRCR